MKLSEKNRKRKKWNAMKLLGVREPLKVIFDQEEIDERIALVFSSKERNDRFHHSCSTNLDCLNTFPCLL